MKQLVPKRRARCLGLRMNHGWECRRSTGPLQSSPKQFKQRTGVQEVRLYTSSVCSQPGPWGCETPVWAMPPVSSPYSYYIHMSRPVFTLGEYLLQNKQKRQP